MQFCPWRSDLAPPSRIRPPSANWVEALASRSRPVELVTKPRGSLRIFSPDCLGMAGAVGADMVHRGVQIIDHLACMIMSRYSLPSPPSSLEPIHFRLGSLLSTPATFNLNDLLPSGLG